MIGRFEVRRMEVAACALLGLGDAVILAGQTQIFTAAATGYLVFTMLLVTLIDSRQLIIPDALSLPATPLGIGAAVSVAPEWWRDVLFEHALAAIVAASFLYFLRWIYRRFRGLDGLGLGDVKLAAAAGAWVGLEELPMTSLIATGSALAAVLARRFVQPVGNLTMTTAIPFGSFIAPSILIVWHLNLLNY